MGLGLFFAALAAFTRDIVEMVNVCLQMAFWFTPIVYVPSILPGWLAHLLLINPMTHVVTLFQNAFVFQESVSLFSLFYLTLTAHLAAFLGLWCVQKLNKDIRDVL